MQLTSRLLALTHGFGKPLRSVVDIDARGLRTGSRRDPVKDRAVERRVDDFVVGHAGPSLKPFILAAAQAGRYLEKSEIVQ